MKKIAMRTIFVKRNCLWKQLLFLCFVFAIFFLLPNRNVSTKRPIVNQPFEKEAKEMLQDLPVISPVFKSIILGDVQPYDSNSSGYNGSAVMLKDDEKLEAQQRYGENEFNVVVSEKISINRLIHPVVPVECLSIESDLPKVSVIVIFYNEAWSTLLRTVQSVLNASGKGLVEEIILVDDASDLDYLKKPLDAYVSRLHSVQLYRLEQRSGLIRARLAGAKYAKGEVLLFLDSHVEVTVGWLPPLLQRIKEDRTRLVSPVIDIIDRNTFEYIVKEHVFIGTFDWSLTFQWKKERQFTTGRIKTAPIPTPAICGGIFAIDKDFFYQIGAYDEKMLIWGGENVEISLRVWMCGGSIEINPCSRVGHVFRKKIPYEVPNIVVTLNKRRLADVWLDSYRKFFYATLPGATNSRLDMNVDDRQELRIKLGCKSMTWYLENVLPNTIPAYYYSFGWVRNEPEDKCLLAENGMKHSVKLSKCRKSVLDQTWTYTALGELRSNLNCLFYTTSRVFVNHCTNDQPKLWMYDHQTGQLRPAESSSSCATVEQDTVILRNCNGEDKLQIWILEEYNGEQYPRNEKLR